MILKFRNLHQLQKVYLSHARLDQEKPNGPKLLNHSSITNENGNIINLNLTFQNSLERVLKIPKCDKYKTAIIKSCYNIACARI